MEKTTSTPVQSVPEPPRERIPIAGPWITEREVEYARDAAARAWYDNHDLYTGRFERAFADYVGVQHAVSLPHCTAGLHLALLAMGVGPGDEVIVPDVTWIASSAPISYVGAEAVFADIDRRTWCLDVESVRQRITERTRAIIVVDLYGSMPDFDGLRNVADAHGIRIIEDAAEAFGSTYKGRKAGSLGDVGVFSFHASKTVSTGEGGMLVTDDEALMQRVRVLRDHGRRPGDRFFLNEEIGFKYKMSPVQAALGLAQVERADELVHRKRSIFEMYRAHLGDVPGITLNHQPPEVTNSYWMVTAVIDPQRFEIDKFSLLKRLEQRGVDGRPFFSPLSSLGAYEGHPQATRGRTDNPVSYEISPYGINLPSAPIVTEAQVAKASGALLEILRECR